MRQPGDVITGARRFQERGVSPFRDSQAAHYTPFLGVSSPARRKGLLSGPVNVIMHAIYQYIPLNDNGIF